MTVKETLIEVLEDVLKLEGYRLVIKPTNYTDSQWWAYKEETQVIQLIVGKLESVTNLLA